MGKLGDLYDRDFVLWTEEQAAALRAARDSNLTLDWENLAEEIESLGKSDRRELASQITRILRRLLKLAVSPAAGPRAGWQESVDDARSEVALLLRDSPSLRREVEAMIREQGPVAARRATADLARHSENAEKIRERFEAGFTAEEVLGDWFPDPPG